MTIKNWRTLLGVRPALRMVRKLRHRKLHRPDVKVPYLEHGTDYGSWPVIKGSLGPSSIVYSFGVGEDLSFDLEAIAHYGCRIEAFDPTPRSLEWVAHQSLPDTLRLHPYGLAGSSRMLRFLPPVVESHVSYAAVGSIAHEGVVELPVHPLDWFMRELDHVRVDYLKMDIEGSEYEVIADLVSKGITPGQVCIEFHHGTYGYKEDDTCSAVNKMKGMGYNIYFVSDSGREYGFIHIDRVSPVT